MQRNRTRTILIAVMAVLALLAFTGPAVAAGQRSVFITTDEVFEPSPSPCANGTFVATGVFSAHGGARSCVRKTWAPGINRGTSELHNSDDLSPVWKVQCKFDSSDRPRHADCKGQWSVNGPNWQGGGNARVVIDFIAGTVEWTFNGKLAHT